MQIELFKMEEGIRDAAFIKHFADDVYNLQLSHDLGIVY